jgi:hypothetical protein
MSLNSCWENFDRWAERMVSKEVTFDAFARATRADFDRLARAAARRRRLPGWMGLDDAANALIEYAWHYALERVSKSGAVGYVAGMYRAGPGAYLRRKLRQKIAKTISRARGENQHRRKGPPAPEFLSKTGEQGGPGGLPELAEESTVEETVVRSQRFARLRALCDSPRELAVLRAIEQGAGDEKRVAATLASERDVSQEIAAAEVARFMSEWTEELGSTKDLAKKTRAKRPSKGAEAWAA